MRGTNGAAGFQGAGRGTMGGFTAGEVLSKDDSGITIKMMDGSTKIVLVNGSTAVMKSAAERSTTSRPEPVWS